MLADYMHIICSQLHENCCCYGNKNCQNIAKHMDPEITKKLFKQAG